MNTKCYQGVQPSKHWLPARPQPG